VIGGEKMHVTKNLASYIKEKGFNISEMSRRTGISYTALYGSLCDPKRDRDLRAEELTAICEFIGKNPMDFADEKG